ncbi:MAG TPA: epoxide hydrolase N-terminal domain-containing protein, partial [Arenicellales bacterium]|nr:epoxide hydrolase N-terminal domain-containing protein [Arenicellales bacterium]
MTPIQPFSINVPDRIISDIRRRVVDFPWHEMPEDGGWAYGTNLDYMKELCTYWVEQFDWRKQETIINSFSQFTAKVDELDVHFIHERGSGSAPLALIISHGWPGSIIEFLDMIDPLAHPERYGGNIEDGFDVIVPS